MTRLMLLTLLLAACANSPAPEFRGAKRVEVTRGGRDFVVYFTDRRVEVVRLGWASPGEHRGIRETMLALVPAVTGCALTAAGLVGDSGEMRGPIRCKGG